MALSEARERYPAISLAGASEIDWRWVSSFAVNCDNSEGHKKMGRSRTWLALGAWLAFGACLPVALCGSAKAGPITLTWSPTAVGLTTSPANTNISANNFDVSDFFDTTISNTGAFSEHAVLTALQFLTGGTPTPLNGLQSTYSFYITVAGTGQESAIPSLKSGLASTGTFTSANYTFWANPNSQPTVTPVPGAAPIITGNGGAFALFTGSLVDGTSTLTAPTGGGYSPTANLDLSLTACTHAGQALATGGTCSGNESAFFVNPMANDINLVVGNFSSTSSVTTLTPGFTSFLDVNGGGGNITFATLIPEPASVTMLVSGLLGMILVGKKRANGQRTKGRRANGQHVRAS
jgi:hypothetical protein